VQCKDAAGWIRAPQSLATEEISQKTCIESDSRLAWLQFEGTLTGVPRLIS